MAAFVKDLLPKILTLPPVLYINTERAHGSLQSRPTGLPAPPRLILERFPDSAVKDVILQQAWRQGKVVFQDRRTFFVQDFSLEQRAPSLIEEYNIKEKWKFKSNCKIEDEQWDKLCVYSHKGTKCQLCKEFDWTIKMRLFLTPLSISNFIKGSNTAIGWRQCGKIGDHTHFF